MKKKLLATLPFITMPVFIPIYLFLDRLLLVDIFGCGCVPDAQTNMLNIPFNANDLRLTVFAILAVGLSVWGVFLSNRFQKKTARIIYCCASIAFNILLALWVIKAFMWA